MLNRKKINCEEAKKIPIGEFLAHFGFNPVEIKKNDSYYLSPFRDEKNPSFRINHRLNIWYDYGISKGGTIIDLGIMLLNCSIEDLLQKLTEINFSSVQPVIKPIESSTINIVETKKLTSPELISYLKSRSIDIKIALKYCVEVIFTLKGKTYYAIGFKNKSNGYELRNKYFKGSSSPKDYTIVNNNSDSLCVFEGFFDFLSYFDSQIEMTGTFDFLILNTIAFLEKSKAMYGKYKVVYLFLDLDSAGTGGASKLKALGTFMCIDKSNEYKGYKDLNEFKMAEGKIKEEYSYQLNLGSDGLSL